MSRISQTQIAEIIRLRENRKSLTFIASRTGLHQSSVLYHLLRNGLDPFEKSGTRVGQRNPFTAEEDARLIDLERQGVKLWRIAKQMNRPITSVRMRSMLLAVRAEKALAG